MANWLHAEYREFHDFPREMVCTCSKSTFPFLSRFDGAIGKYTDYYQAFPFDVARRSFLEYDSIAPLLASVRQMSRPRLDAFSQFEFDGWQRVADRYESAWSGLTRLFIPPLLEATKVTRGSCVLDVACGPGYAAELARDLGASAIGLDFSPAIVRLAQARYPDIPFHTGDAQALKLDDHSFDVVVMNFGVLHLSRPEAAFGEARRVLRPGGYYGFTIWASPEHSPGARIVNDAVQAHADPNVMLPDGPDYFGYGDAEACRETLGKLGFAPASLVFRTVTCEWQVPTAAFVFGAERDAGVRTAALLTAQTPDIQIAIQTRMEEALLPYANRDGFSIPYAAHIVAARAA